MEHVFNFQLNTKRLYISVIEIVRFKEQLFQTFFVVRVDYMLPGQASDLHISNNMKTLKTLVLSALFVNQLHAQVDVSQYIQPVAQLHIIATDSIELARTCAYQKDFANADLILTKYNAEHCDINALRLHAQLIYWMKDFDRSIALYEETLQFFPAPSPVHLDYARVTYSLGKFPKTQKLLKIYKQFDSSNAEADIMTAYIDLWNGKNKSAQKIAEQLLAKYPGNAEATDIMSKIHSWTVPYAKAGMQIISDDQPVKGQSYYAEAGVYKSWLFAPTVQTVLYRFKMNDSSFHSSWVQLGNTIQLGMKTKLKFKGGLFQQNGRNSELSGGAEISRQITKHFSLQAMVDKRPYQYTMSSIRNIVMENVSGVSVNYNRNDKWYGKSGYDAYKYGDDNKIRIAYLWIIAPVVSTPHFSVSGGYAFRYADALKTTYTSKKTMSEVVGNWPPVNGIPGFYNPYFTPEAQTAHSALASIKISPTKKLKFTSSLNIAFSAKADNPYLYVDSHDNGLYFNHGFAKVNYTPTSWVNELSLAASSKLFVTANYSFDKLLYYQGHRGSIELKYVFSK